MRSSSNLVALGKIWNRKGHYYLGLYLLFFLWLFAFTGLLLNHTFAFADFWPSRIVSKFERTVTLSASDGDEDRAIAVMASLGIRGEIEWSSARPVGRAFEFRVNKPGKSWNVKVFGDENRAEVEETAVNAWGMMRALHSFTGVRSGDERNRRDWILTTLWALSMDAVSAGIVVLVLSGLYLWWGLPGKRMLGGFALLAGTVASVILVVALKMFS